MRKLKRYAVVIDTYVYAENDYMARKKAHECKKEVDGVSFGDHTRVIEITECPFASIDTRELEDISEPKGLFTQMGMDEVELPF
tara:strand:- start:158 stop:409 length:252 start_codon:yes stop_codon:yes gene_type:complete